MGFLPSLLDGPHPGGAPANGFQSPKRGFAERRPRLRECNDDSACIMSILRAYSISRAGTKQQCPGGGESPETTPPGCRASCPYRSPLTGKGTGRRRALSSSLGISTRRRRRPSTSGGGWARGRRVRRSSLRSSNRSLRVRRASRKDCFRIRRKLGASQEFRFGCRRPHRSRGDFLT